MSNTVTSTALGRGGAWVLGNRALMRAPICLYRARLGFLFGSRTLMLEHVGRKSGAKRYVMLEVVGHPAPDTYVVASGFGERSQWFRNLMVNPRTRVSVAGHGPRAATARRLPTGEADAVLADYVTGIPARGQSSRTSWRTRSARRSANTTPRCPWSSCTWTDAVHEPGANYPSLSPGPSTMMST